MDEPSAPPVLSRERKIGLFLLLVFALLAVGLGVLQIRNNMYAPFALTNRVSPLIDANINDADSLRFRDTDKDGLNDFDELYVYKTSPYLDDTDSDGTLDKQEIEGGTNPLCVEGQNCEAVLSGSTAVPTRSVTSSLGDPDEVVGERPVDISGVLDDPQALRQLLIDTGVQTELLDTLSDNQLRALINNVLASSTLQTGLQELSEVPVSGQ